MTTGTNVSLQIFTPDLQSPVSAQASAIISEDEIEFNDVAFFDLNGDPFGVVPASLDLFGAYINYSLLVSGSFTNVPDTGFNGYGLTFDALTESAGQIKIRVADLLDAQSTLNVTQSSISFDDDTVFLNVDGLSFSTGDTVVIRLGYEINGSISADFLQGDAGRDLISGGEGKDHLVGAGGDDTLLGGDGEDTLRGGFGNDALSGNVGADRFVFDTALNASKNVDTISTVSSLDKIVVDNDIFTALGSSFTTSEFRAINTGTSFTSVDSSDNIIYVKSTGQLFYDRDGSGTTYARVLFAELADNTSLAFSQLSMIE